MRADVLIVGAGISGLACARELARGGARPRLLERSRGPGGRCATRRLEGVPVDHGPGFLHGSDARFLRALEAVDGATPCPGWPVRRAGAGRPCQRAAFTPGEARLAWAEGVNAFPRHLARGLDIRTGSPVVHLAASAGEVRARTEDGEEASSPWLVLALPAGQAAPLVATLDADRERDAALALLEGTIEDPCLAVLAAYDRETPDPPWDVLYPESSDAVQLVSHEGGKRPGAPVRPLVVQALPSWSRRRLETPPEAWGRELLEEAARHVGDWVRRPRSFQAHRWRHARAEAGTVFLRPMAVPLPGGGRLGLTGEAFDPAGGAQGAWKAGRAMARRVLGEEPT